MTDVLVTPTESLCEGRAMGLAKGLRYDGDAVQMSVTSWRTSV
jgi:hypothetical protein